MPQLLYVEVGGPAPWFLSLGAMIASYGQMPLEPLTRTSLGAMVACAFSSPSTPSLGRRAGAGKCVIGDRGYTINSHDLDAGNLTTRAANLLGFESNLELKQSIVPGFITLIGTGKFCHHYDAGWMGSFLGAACGMLLGARSGEDWQYNFTGEGTVLIQASERVIADPQMVAHIESETISLGQPQLAQPHRTIGARLQQ